MNIIKRNGTFWKEIPFNVANAEAIRTKAKHGIVLYKGKEARLLATDINNHNCPIAAVVNNGMEEKLVEADSQGNVYRPDVSLQLLVPTKFKTYENFTPCKFQACLVKEEGSDIWRIAVCSGHARNGNPTFFAFPASDYLPLCEATLPLYCTSKSWQQYVKEFTEKEDLAANTPQPATDITKEQ